MATVSEVRLALAEALEENPEALTAANAVWLSKLREGVLVHLHIGRWRARTSLRWEDLGIQLDEDAPSLSDLDALLELGHKLLLPRDIIRRLDAVDSAARKWLEQNAFRTLWGFFVPVTAYRRWKRRNETFRQEYLSLRDRLAERFDETVQQVLTQYRTVARTAFCRLSSLHPEAVRGMGEEEFVEQFVEEIRRQIPSAEQFYGSFRFDVQLQFIPLPSTLAEEEAEAARIRNQARIEQERAWDERWRAEELREMNREVLAQARAQKEQIVDAFLRDVVAQLRTLVYEAATDVLASLRRNGYLHPRSVVQLRNLIQQVELLNFTGDQEVETMVQGVRARLDLAGSPRGAEDMGEVLRDIAVVARATLLRLGEQPRSARNLGVPDAPAPELVRAARGRLALDARTPPALPGLERRRGRPAPQPSERQE